MQRPFLCGRSYKNGDRGQTYHFTRVFGPETDQGTYFEATAAPMVRSTDQVHRYWPEAKKETIWC